LLRFQRLKLRDLWIKAPQLEPRTVFLQAKPKPSRHGCPFLSSRSSVRSPKSFDLDSQLAEINQQMLDAHSSLSVITRPDIDVVIVYKGSELSLWLREENTYHQKDRLIPTDDLRYTRLKQFAHITVLLTVLLEACAADAANIMSILDRIAHLHQSLSLMSALLGETHPEDRPHHARILAASIELMRGMDHQSDFKTMLENYIEALRETISYHNRTATQVQLLCLNEILQGWIGLHGIDINKSRVIIVSPHGPRLGRIETQFFQKWYEQAGIQQVEDNMLYSIETLPHKIAELDIEHDLIGKHLMGAELNKKIGTQVMGNMQAMFRDILEVHAAPVLETMFQTTSYRV